MMNYTPLRGLVAATHTPFKPDCSLNLAAVEQQAAHLCQNRISTVFVGGTTGESHSLSLEERRQLAVRWFEVARGGPLRVVLHVGSNCLDDAKLLAAQAETLGASAISALAPSYFKPRSLHALIQWCAEIAAAAPKTPFYFYDIPMFTGTQFPMAEFLAQASDRIPTLTGIKFTNYDLMAYQLCLRADDSAFDILWGVDEFLLAALALGARGAVGSSYNFAAPIYHRLIAAFEQRDLNTARAEQFRSVQLIRVLAAYGYMGASKAVMKMLGVDVGPARLPNTNPSPEQVSKLGRELQDLGFFEWIKPSRPPAEHPVPKQPAPVI
jgi:N-acetylneuraminate lyase